MDFAIQENDLTFEKADSILNNIYLSLMVRQGSFFQNPDFGSRLHLLSREKNTQRVADLAKEYCREALQWIIDTGRSDRIDIEIQRDRNVNSNRLKALVTARQADGRVVTFESFLEVI